MRSAAVLVIASSVLLGGCNRGQNAEAAGNRNPGRFAGIGTFDAGPLWSQIVHNVGTSDRQVAQLADDEHVIVVLDSHTGEVRQCGDHSGYCVAMNPWTGGAAAGLPVRLQKHASDLAAEDTAAVPPASEPAATAPSR